MEWKGVNCMEKWHILPAVKQTRVAGVFIDALVKLWPDRVKSDVLLPVTDDVTYVKETTERSASWTDTRYACSAGRVTQFVFFIQM